MFTGEKNGGPKTRIEADSPPGESVGPVSPIKKGTRVRAPIISEGHAECQGAHLRENIECKAPCDAVTGDLQAARSLTATSSRSKCGQPAVRKTTSASMNNALIATLLGIIIVSMPIQG